MFNFLRNAKLYKATYLFKTSSSFTYHFIFAGSERFMLNVDVCISLYQYQTIGPTECFHIRKNLLLFFMTLLPVLVPLHFHINHSISFLFFTCTQNLCLHFYWGCIDPVDKFGNNWYLNSIQPSNKKICSCNHNLGQL